MAVGIWCELVCERCAIANYGQFVFGQRVPRGKLVKEAKSAGWQFVGDAAFCSSYCLDKYREEKENGDR